MFATIIGLFLYLFDIGTDIYVASKYWENGDTWWFEMAIAFIFVPSVIVNAISFAQLVNPWSCLVSVLQLSMVARYMEKIVWNLNPMRFARLRYLQAIMGSAPQCCLQVYVMLRQWYFPKYAVASIVFSLLSLAWSIAELETAKRHDQFEIVEKFAFLVWQLFTLMSRLSAIAFFAYVFGYYVILFLAIHWLLMVAYKICTTAYNSAEALLTSFPAIFYSNTVLGYFFIVVENVAMVTLCLTIRIQRITYLEKAEPVLTILPHMHDLKRMAIFCLTAGSFTSFVFMVIYRCVKDSNCRVSEVD